MAEEVSDQSTDTLDQSTGKRDHALALVRRGLYIVPLHTVTKDGVCSCRKGAACGRNTGKHPIIREWEKKASNDTEQIITWWRRWPDANIGVKTGAKSGVVVLDVDPGKHGDETLHDLEAQYGSLPRSWRSQTGGGGEHLWFRHPGDQILHDCVLGPGLEVRADGGQVVAPGSMHRSGREYLWQITFEPDGTPLMACPEWLIGFLLSPGGDPSTPMLSADETSGPQVPMRILLRRAVNMSNEKGRNNAGFWLACQLRDNSYDVDEAGRVMEDFVDGVGTMNTKSQLEVYSDGEALHSLREAFKREPRKPWSALQIATIKVDNNGNRLNSESPTTDPMIGVEPVTLDECVATFRRWLYLEDPGAIYATLAAIAADQMNGTACWLMLVGASSGGKTEILTSVSMLPRVYPAATLSVPSLLSGTSRRERTDESTGGLLREIGDFGILVCKDFTSVLSMPRDPRGELLAALREIYDGRWMRKLGVDGGRTLVWEGKLGFLGGCTSTIDSHHTVMAAMGERFLFYRLPDLDPEQQGRQALLNTGREDEMRDDLRRAVTGVFAGITIPRFVSLLEGQDLDRMVALGTLAARGRSAVERDGRTRTIDLILDTELPARVSQALHRLYAGAQAIGVSVDETWRLISKIALDCMPKLRRQVLSHLVAHPEGQSTRQVAQTLGYPTDTSRYALEDLTAHKVVIRQTGSTDRWYVSQWTRRQWRIAGLPIPDQENGDGHGIEDNDGGDDENKSSGEEF